MRRVRWHTECNNLVLLAKVFKSRCMMAAVAVHNQKTILTLRTSCSRAIKVLNPFKANLIVCPALFACTNSPSLRYTNICSNFVPRLLILLCFKYHKHWQGPASRADAVDDCHPLAIAWLYDLCAALLSFFSPCDNFCCWNHAHLKARLVEVIDIIF